MVASRTSSCADALASAKASLQHLARDHARVPLSWSTAPHNGFSPPHSTVAPWMRPLDDAHVCNAAHQQGDKHSVLAFWKTMLRIRRDYNDLLVHGEFDDVDEANEHFFAFTKTWRDRKALVVCNFSEEARAWDGVAKWGKKEMLVSSVGNGDEATHYPFEGRMYLIS